MTENKKARCLIIDDNRFIIEVLTDLLTSAHKQIHLVGTASSASEGLSKIRSLKPDLVFLDVEMPDFNGFELLCRVDEISFQTIFITSFSHYAISAIRFNALDYLLKPIDADQLNDALERFEKSHEAKRSFTKMALALENLQQEDVGEQIFSLSTQSGEKRMKLRGITMITGDRNYSRIHLEKEKAILSSKNLKYFEDILVDKGFFRCHRSSVVNLTHVLRIRSDSFIMKDGSNVSISRRKKAEAKKRLNGDDSMVGDRPLDS